MIARLCLILFTCLATTASAQVIGPPKPGDGSSASTPSMTTPAVPIRPNAIELATIEPESFNPISVLASASSALPGAANKNTKGADGLSVGLNIMVLLTVITLVPSIMLMTTCFLRILIVLALLRQAIGTPSLPPAQVVTGLALFMTLMVMTPTIDRIWNEAVVPYQQGEITDYETLWNKAKQPLRDYMFDQIEATDNWGSVYTLLNYRNIDTSEPAALTRADVDMVTLVPAYILSELKIGFMMGFRVYLPFLVIDMVIASLLISMSMMMLPPVLISLPFKLLLFVLVDGWALVIGSILESFVQDGMSSRMSAEAAAMMGAPFLLLLFIRNGPLKPIPPTQVESSEVKDHAL